MSTVGDPRPRRAGRRGGRRMITTATRAADTPAARPPWRSTE